MSLQNLIMFIQNMATYEIIVMFITMFILLPILAYGMYKDII